MDKRPIGVFDSGVGGLSVVKTILEVLPNEEIVYFGDTKRAPYGVRTTEQITDFSTQIVNFLLEKKCKAIVIACNTICVSSLDSLRAKFDVPIIEVITPSVKEAAEISKKGVGVFATKATINSQAHKKGINDIKSDLPVYGVACTLFVDIVEQGFAETDVAYEATKEYYKEFKGAEIDSLILGCTHFPLMKEKIQKAVGNDIKIIDPALGTSNELKNILEENNILRTTNSPNHLFGYSGDTETFKTILKTVLKKDYNIEKIDIEKY